MVYVQFFQNSTGYVPGTIPPRFDPAYVKPIEATGDRGVLIVDGRLSAENIGRIAAEECRRRGFVAWQVFKGESFTRSRAVSGRWPVCESRPAKAPVWLSAHGM